MVISDSRPTIQISRVFAALEMNRTDDRSIMNSPGIPMLNCLYSRDILYDFTSGRHSAIFWIRASVALASVTASCSASPKSSCFNPK